MNSPDAASSLLFGLLALQNHLVTRDGLMAGFGAWMTDRSRPLAEVLVAQGALRPEHRGVLESLAAALAATHGGDAGESLAALGTAGASAQATIAHLAAQAPGDADVQATLGRLLRPQERTESDAEATIPWRGRPEDDGRRYRVLRPHAQGNLGVVSVAMDAELHREVALKEIQTRFADDPVSRARFVLEAEVTGRLEHPGVVPVYGLGTGRDGRPYYAMRLVRGETLKEAIERLHGETSPASPASGGRELPDATHDTQHSAPRSRDSRAQSTGPRAPGSGSSRPPLAGSFEFELRRLLRRFLDVCNTMAYAHSRGVIHRDLKPANILLGPYGETLVVDWGLAKVVGRSDAEVSPEATLRPASGSGSAETQTGAAVGTPAYMSPEQAEGRHDAVGPASDIYSLGASLYALLAGRPPFGTGDVAETLRRVGRGAFPAPREVHPDVPRPLDAIVRKAMALDPRVRYATARALADDIERWLADEPVAAYDEPWTVRARRWTRRHRTAVATSLGVWSMAVVGLVVFALLVGAKNRALGVANGALAAQRQQAEQRATLAMDAIARFHDAVAREPVLKNDSALADLRTNLLREPVAFYRKLRDQLQGERNARGESSLIQLATASQLLARFTGEVGDREGALRAYREALDIGEQLVREHPAAPQYRTDLAEMHKRIAALEKDAGRPDEAVASYRRAIAIEQALTEANPWGTSYLRALGGSYQSLGDMQSKLWPDEALASYGQALAIRARLAKENPPLPDDQSGLGATLNNMAVVEMDRRAWSAARPWLVEAIVHQDAALKASPRHATYRQYLRNHLMNLARVERELRHPAESAQAARRWAALMAGEPTELYDAACALALGARMIEGKGQRAEGEGQGDDLADEAMAVLERAVVAGWGDAAWTARDPDLVVLHERGDFRRLLGVMFDRIFPAWPFAPGEPVAAEAGVATGR
jgi:serine/threonine protein kinase